MYLVAARVEATVPGEGFTSESDEARSYGLHVGAGVAAHVATHLTLGAEVKYLIVSARIFGPTTGLNSLVVGGQLGYAF